MWNQRKWAPPLFRSAASAVLTVLCVLATRSPAMGVGERFVGPPRVWTVSDLQDLSTDVVQVKFVEGSNVSLRNGRFEDDSGLDLSRLYAVLEGRRDAVLSVHPTFPEDRQVLRDWQRKGEEACACVGPDLSLWFDLKITGGAGAVVQLVNELEELPCVEIAHPAPCPRPASESATPGLLGAPTSPRERAPEHSSPGGTQQGSTSGAPIPDLTPLQGYLYEPPFGLNATALHTYPGGFGEGQRLIDFELYVSVPDHVEFDPSKLFYVGEVVEARSEHMTKSLGSILGIHDSEGIDGIAPAVEYGIENLDAQDDFGAQCLKAIAPLQQGDVWLIEVDLNGGPFERLQSVYDVIWTATMGRGIVCVEPAGNGAHDLDDPVYGGVFDREVRDSGAILCAAGFADALDRVPVSSWGSRVDVHAWGENVVTTGGGDLYDGGTPQTEYTGSFCCTSSASSLIAGGVTALQGVARMAFGAPLDP
ncbi:MAG: hypothetical protein KC729_16045, partial [Candidatus Eisenbacteria bacterium]|nr:hypothetical protein [Candidatus Eisenbacteria bacterium]